jgi:hypothetical protein
MPSLEQSAKFDWRAHWPWDTGEFVAENKKPYHSIRINREGAGPGYAGRPPFVTVHFRKRNLAEKLAEVAKKLGRLEIAKGEKEISMRVSEGEISRLLFGSEEGFESGKYKIGHHSCWFPWKGNDPHSLYEYRQPKQAVNPTYPVYIISKGRWELPLTARALERMGVDYKIVVEPEEYDRYVASFEKGYDGGKPFTGKIHRAPENFSKRGHGSIPVRNYVWDLAIKEAGPSGRHWLMDDNIPTFNRTHNNLGVRVQTGEIFRNVEIVADMHENIAITGLQNSQFVISKWEWPAYFLNTRVYSCTLIKNDLRLPTAIKGEDRWRGKYNEDTDLCIRALKAGCCTLLWVTFNADKVGTMVMKGGNTDKLYAGNGRAKMAESLYEQHPDVVKVGDRWQRKQHVVNYPACVEIGKKSKPGGCVLKKNKKYRPLGRMEMVRFNRKTGRPETEK